MSNSKLCQPQSGVLKKSFAAICRMDSSTSSLDVSTSSISSMSSEEYTYYGVYIPPDDGIFAEEMVFTDKAEAIKVVKYNRRARFKGFSSEDEAVEFSRSGGDSSSSSSSTPTTPKSDQILFRSLRPQELVLFRKAVESNDLNTVENLILDNPRYLIGSGDTPTILHEGSRYNALHVAARNNAFVVLDHILTVIAEPNFIKKVYGNQNSSHEGRSNVILDLYLNMPEKGCHETPLHFASKLGFVKIVKTLVSYPQCDRKCLNKDGLTAAQVVCTRASKQLMNSKSAILELLDSQYFVPVFRSVDNSVPPVIGEPFNNLNLPISPQTSVTPSMEVRAVAGPMPEDKARIFRKKWKTPPRNSNSPVLNSRPELADPEKGLEKIGRTLASEFSVPWKEYWSFLGSFEDLSSPDGLSALENYLKKKYDQAYQSNLLNECSCMPSCQSLHCLWKTPEQRQKRFIDNPFDLPSILSLEMTKLSISSPRKIDNENGYKKVSYYNSPTKQYDENNQNLTSPTYWENISKPPVDIDTMEKCCQVYSTRLANAFVTDRRFRIMQEISKFQVFLAGCSSDYRFKCIDLRKCHYRLALLASFKLIAITVDLDGVISRLKSIIRFEPTYHIQPCKLDPENVIAAALCIIRKCIDILEEANCRLVIIKPPSNQQELNLTWKKAEVCICPSPVLKGSTRNSIVRNLFPPDEDQTEECVMEDDGNEDESSDEEEYLTAPNSPLLGSPSPSISGEDDEMFLCETGPDVFLDGKYPTKLDKAVLEALNGVPIRLKSYPHILLWKRTCLDYAQKESIDRWPTPGPSRYS